MYFYQSVSEEVDEPLNVAAVINVLKNCPKLKELDLSNNKIATIPSNISTLKSLQTLILTENNITEFPSELFDLTALQQLSFGQIQLKKIPSGIGKLTNLKTLIANSNWQNKMDCTALFDEIEHLDNLQTLELWSCLSVTHLPESISKLKKLTKIDVDNNLLTTLPQSIFKMQQLKYLRISTNKIPSEEVEKLKNALKNTKVVS